MWAVMMNNLVAGGGFEPPGFQQMKLTRHHFSIPALNRLLGYLYLCGDEPSQAKWCRYFATKPRTLRAVAYLAARRIRVASSRFATRSGLVLSLISNSLTTRASGEASTLA